MSADVLNPVQVETAIRETSRRMADGVGVCNSRYEAYLTADREFDRAYAHAYLAHQGPSHEKRYAADLATMEQRAVRDTADAAYRYADRTARALENELRAWQSVGASVRSMYAVAGRGEA